MLYTKEASLEHTRNERSHSRDESGFSLETPLKVLVAKLVTFNSENLVDRVPGLLARTVSTDPKRPYFISLGSFYVYGPIEDPIR